VRRRGLKFGVSSHRAFNWGYYTFDDEFDTVDPQNVGLYGVPHPPNQPSSREFMDDWFARTKEMMDRFQPDVIYFDFGWHQPEFAPYRPKLLAYYYNRAIEWGKEVVLNYKAKMFPDEVAVFDVERGKLTEIAKRHWQADTSVSYQSWGYIESDNFKTVTTLVHDLVDVVSKNGNLLLNVGPRADGTIPDEAANLLLGVGEWLKVNGEAIYETRPWWKYGEGPTDVQAGTCNEHAQKAFTSEDVRFTRKGDTVYAILLGWPEKETKIRLLGSSRGYLAWPIGNVELLGSKEPVVWSQEEDGLRVSMPATKPCDHAYVLKITK